MSGMEDEKKSGTAHLEGFLLVANNSSGKSSVQVIHQVLANANIFVFGELLEVPSIKQLDKTEFQPHLDLLKVFAYGTYLDYKDKAPKQHLPQLTPPQLRKLKQLSIVDFCSRNKAVPYSQLCKDLDISNVRELEDLIIDCVYAGLIQGKLDQKVGAFEVQNVIGRDLGPQDVSEMMASLDRWLKAAEQLQESLDKKIVAANQAHERAKKEEEDLAKQKADVVEALKLQREQGGGGGTDGGSDLMGFLGGGRRRPGGHKGGGRQQMGGRR